MFKSLDVIKEAKGMNEIEHVLIVKFEDYDELVNMAHKTEMMEQWEVKSAGNNDRSRRGRGSIRVRAINNKKFILTTKNYSNDGVSATEVEQDTTRDMFNVFKKICPMGSKKQRLSIKHEGHVIEVDVYFDAAGNPVPWCKVDIEVANSSVGIPKLPFRIEGNPITIDRTPEEEKFVLELFQTKFQIYNKDSIHPLDIGFDH